MQTVIFLFVVISAVQSVYVEEEWENYKATYKKTYKNDVEDSIRHGIFNNNLRKINGHNKRYQTGEVSYKMGINQFADLTRDEYMEMLTLQREIKPNLSGKNLYTVVNATEELPTVPKKVNWTEEGVVTRIKDQMSCGSSWSFSATGSLEGQLFHKTGNLTSLSEQNLLDCVTGCDGCSGGHIEKALKYVKSNSIMKENDYPYEGKKGICRFESSKTVTKIRSLWNIKSNDEKGLRDAVANVGPISVAIDATGLQFYKNGIYKDDFSCGNSIWNLNHGALLVGYGTIDGLEYWLIKNSWGTSWGLEGYLLMARNNDNQCGIATDAVFPQF